GIITRAAYPAAQGLLDRGLRGSGRRARRPELPLRPPEHGRGRRPALPHHRRPNSLRRRLPPAQATARRRQRPRPGPPARPGLRQVRRRHPPDHRGVLLMRAGGAKRALAALAWCVAGVLLLASAPFVAALHPGVRARLSARLVVIANAQLKPYSLSVMAVDR